MNNRALPIKDTWSKNQPVLLQVTSGFGFNETHSLKILQEVRAMASSASCHMEDLSLRLWLVKKVVQKCVFLVSNDMFQCKTNYVDHELALERRPYLRSFMLHQTRHMPLPVWTTYLLVDIIGFNELEVASILNTHPFKIREQLSMARKLIA